MTLRQPESVVLTRLPVEERLDRGTTSVMASCLIDEAATEAVAAKDECRGGDVDADAYANGDEALRKLVLRAEVASGVVGR